MFVTIYQLDMLFASSNRFSEIDVNKYCNLVRANITLTNDVCHIDRCFIEISSSILPIQIANPKFRKSTNSKNTIRKTALESNEDSNPDVLSIVLSLAKL